MVIDPFADMSAMAASRGMQFDYPPIEGVEADLLLVTHEHIDHNGVEAIGGDPGDPALDRRPPGVADRRDRRDRLRARCGGGHRTGTQHDLRLRARRDPRVSLRRLRPVGAARRAGRGDRPGRPVVRPRRRRSDGRRRAGRRRSSSACRRAGSCRCTTARRGSAFWRRPTRSSTRRGRSSGSRARASTPVICPRRTVR